MRVLHLVTATHQRGAETVARNLADELERCGIEGRVVALVPGHADSGSIKVDAVLTPDPASHLRWIPAAVAGLRRELRDHPADVVLAHGAHAAFVSAALPGCPPIVWHRILESPDREPLNPFRLAQRALAKRVAGAIAITPGIATEMRALGFRGPVWYVPNHRPAPTSYDGDNQELARQEVRTELGFGPDAPIVALVGHLVPQKDPCAAIQVFADIARRVPAARFVVAGDGPLRGDAEILAHELVGEGRVVFVGHRSDVAGIFAGSDLMLLTSQSDSMPGIAIEAQLAGCPVVSYPVDGIAEIVSHAVTGLVTNTRSVAAAADSCVDLLRDPSRRAAMSTAARCHALPFTTEHVAPRYEAILDMVAASPPSDGRVRVMHVLPNLGVGGAEQALRVLATTVPDNEMAQIVTSIGGTRRPIEETVHPDLQRAGVAYCDLGVGKAPTRSPLALLAATRRLRRVLRRTNVDVVDSALLDAALPSRLAPHGVLRFTHLVNTTYEDIVGTATGARRWRRTALRMVDAVTARRDSRMIALTDTVADSNARALRLGTEERPVVISRGVDIERFSPASVAADPKLILSVGRLVPQKGHDTLVRAIACANARGADLRLHILGEGPLEADLSDLIRQLGLDSSVELLGPVSDVRPHLAAAGIFALASRWEGQSNAVLEAMAMELPVVLSDIATFEEVAGEAGYRVVVDDPRAWSAALVALSEDESLRSTLGARARERAKSHYAATDRSLDLLEEYRSALADSEHST